MAKTYTTECGTPTPGRCNIADGFKCGKKNGRDKAKCIDQCMNESIVCWMKILRMSVG